MTKVFLVMHRQSQDWYASCYDTVKIVTLDSDLAIRYVEDNQHNYPIGCLFVEVHDLMEPEIRPR